MQIILIFSLKLNFLRPLETQITLNFSLKPYFCVPPKPSPLSKFTWDSIPFKIRDSHPSSSVLLYLLGEGPTVGVELAPDPLLQTLRGGQTLLGELQWLGGRLGLTHTGICHWTEIGLLRLRSHLRLHLVPGHHLAGHAPVSIISGHRYTGRNNSTLS